MADIEDLLLAQGEQLRVQGEQLRALTEIVQSIRYDVAQTNERIGDVERSLSKQGEQINILEIRSSARAADIAYGPSPYSSSQRLGVHSAASPRHSAKPRGIY